MGADSGIEHRATTTRTDHAEAARPFGSSSGQAHYDGHREKDKGTEFHWLLPDIAGGFRSPIWLLSQVRSGIGPSIRFRPREATAISQRFGLERYTEPQAHPAAA